ncbi:MAG: helix-turn-helix domain-containing protein [Treponema sp.]
MGFKENLKSELDYQGMLVKELSLKSGIKKQTLDNYLSTHNSVPNAEIAVKIAKALGTTVEYLITGENSENSGESSSEEIKHLVSSFKKLSPEKRALVINLLNFL